MSNNTLSQQDKDKIVQFTIQSIEWVKTYCSDNNLDYESLHNDYDSWSSSMKSAFTTYLGGL